MKDLPATAQFIHVEKSALRVAAAFLAANYDRGTTMSEISESGLRAPQLSTDGDSLDKEIERWENEGGAMLLQAGTIRCQRPLSRFWS